MPPHSGPPRFGCRQTSPGPTLRRGQTSPSSTTSCFPSPSPSSSFFSEFSSRGGSSDRSAPGWASRLPQGEQVQVVRRHIQAIARRADSAGGGLEEQEVEQQGVGQVLYNLYIHIRSGSLRPYNYNMHKQAYPIRKEAHAPAHKQS